MKKHGHIIIIEGIWGAGKTTLIRKLSRKLHAVRIPEPDHRKSGQVYPVAITRWYFAAHRKNLDRALAYARKGRTVLIERSVLSSAVFSHLYLHKKDYHADINKFAMQLRTAAKEKIDCRILYLPPRPLPRTIAAMERKPHLREFAEKEFLIACDQLLKKMIASFQKK